MKKCFLIILLLQSTFTTLLAQDSNYSRRDSFFLHRNTTAVKPDSTYMIPYQLGDSVLNFHFSCFFPCESNIIFLNVHDNENTSVEAAETFLPSMGGTLFQLKHSGNRLIGFNVNDSVYYVDPNRIFSSAGIKASLIKNNKKSFTTEKRKSIAAKKNALNAEAAKLVKQFADQILDSIVTNKKLVVALHNNTEGSFSINSYKKGGEEYKATALLYINAAMDADDFILTTERTIYDKIRDKNLNVVLQLKTAPDDGSLSVYAQKKMIPYINVEAQADHLEEQTEMLEALKDIIAEYQTVVNK